MRFARAAVISCMFSLVLSSIAIPATSADAQQGSVSACANNERKLRDDSILIGSSISYGNSLQEVALYRLITGIDTTLLDDRFQVLSWGPPKLPNDVNETAAQFSDLLLPTTQLRADPTAYARYYRAQDMLIQSGLRSYRPERGGSQEAADWWLHDNSDPVYRSNDFVNWLQSMAASDTFHRIDREYGRAFYRPLISSWTYFDPKRWDVERYDRVTAQALDKWQKDGKLIWATVAFSRVRTDQPEADTLIDWFYALHERVKSCTASKEELILYPLFRFHTLRLLFMRAAYLSNAQHGAARTYYDKAMALLGDTIANARISSTVSDETAAKRAALLMIGYSDSGQSFYPTPTDLLAGTTPQAKSWRDLRWASASSFDDYLKLAVNQIPSEEELEILNGLTTTALYRLIERKAFDPETRRKLAESGWARAYLLGQNDLSRHFLEYLAGNDAGLQNDAKVVLESPKSEWQRESLLFLLRHADLSVQIDSNINSHSLWCNGLGVDAYQNTVSDIMGPVLRMAEIPQLDQWWTINYWYEYDSYNETASSPAYSGAKPSLRWPKWLNANFNYASERKSDVVDYAELSQLGHLPLPRDLLIGRVLDWAASERNHVEALQAFFHWKGDQRVAEALHLAIRDTRNICRVGDPHRMSRAAWVVLHSNPRWKSWADKTPYWYN